MLGQITFAQYAMSNAPQAARDRLAAYPKDVVRGTSKEELEEQLHEWVRIPEVELSRENAVRFAPSSPGSGSGELLVGLHIPGHPNAEYFFELLPSTRIGGPGQPFRRGDEIVVQLAGANASQAASAIQSNLERTNRDIRSGDAALREHLRNVVDARVRELDRESAEAERNLEAVRQSGIPIEIEGADEPDPVPGLSSRRDDAIPAPELPHSDDDFEPVVFDASDIPDEDRDRLSRWSAMLAADDAKAFDIVVGDVIRRMRSLADAHPEAVVRLHADSAAASLAIIQSAVRGEIASEFVAPSAMALRVLVARLAEIGLVAKFPELAVVIEAGQLITEFLRARRETETPPQGH